MIRRQWPLKVEMAALVHVTSGSSLSTNPPSIYCHTDWTEQERVEAGAFTSSAERMIAMYTEGAPTSRLTVDTEIFDFYNGNGAPSFGNSHSFAEDFAPQDMNALK